MNKNLTNTNTSTTTIKKNVLPEITLDKKGKLYISEQMQNHIDYLHQEVGAIEWSGVLLYNIQEGSILEPETLKIKAEDLYLMDIGKGHATDFDLEYSDIKNIHELFPNANPRNMKENPEAILRKGLIHTHHNMGAYFSSVDMDEIHDNTPNNDLYLSLVVDFKGEYVAKLCFIVENTGSYKVLGREEVFRNKEPKKLCMIDLEVISVKDVNPTEQQIARYKEVEKMNAPAFETNLVLTKYSAVSFIENLLVRHFPNAIEKTYSGFPQKIAAIKKSLKAINKEYKKFDKREKDRVMFTIQDSIVEVVVESKYMHQKLDMNLVNAYLLESVKVLKDEFSNNNKPSTLVKELIEALSAEDVMWLIATNIGNANAEEDGYTYVYPYEWDNYVD